MALGTGHLSRAISAGGHTLRYFYQRCPFCWGKNDKGQLGVGDNEDRNSPVAVDVGEGLTVKSVSAGGEHTCALLSNGSMKCWGEGGTGQLLGGTPDDQSDPPEAMDLDDTFAAKDISMGPEHACALLNTVRLSVGARTMWGSWVRGIPIVWGKLRGIRMMKRMKFPSSFRDGCDCL